MPLPRLLYGQKAGFDGIEICANSGYLVSQFLPPLTNRRVDKYGGDTLQKASFLLSILEETRRRAGYDLNICVKFDAEDGIKGGKTLDDSFLLAPHTVSAGADRLHGQAGTSRLDPCCRCSCRGEHSLICQLR